MILAPHAIAGAATAIIFRKYPIAAIVVAFLSHFALDAIPHWAYKLNSIKKDSSKQFGFGFVRGNGILKDVLKTGIDFSLGLTVALWISGIFFPQHLWLTFLGACAGIFPDFLQIIYYLYPSSLLFYLQRAHIKTHMIKTHHLDDQTFLGISYQIIFSLAVILVMIFVAPRF